MRLLRTLFSAVILLGVLVGAAGSDPLSVSDIDGHVGSFGLGYGPNAEMQCLIMDDGRSAPTGPFMNRQEARTLASYLRTAWKKRGGPDWHSSTIYDSDRRWVAATVQDHVVRLVSGDRTHTAKSFKVSDEAQLNSICRAFSGAAPPPRQATPSLGEGPKYPTRP